MISDYLEYAKAIYDYISLEQNIDLIYQTIYQTYFDIARSHLRSAKETLEMLRVSKEEHDINTNNHIEILESIHHLYDAYYILDDMLTKEKNSNGFPLFKKTEYVVKNQKEVLIPIFEICMLISILYRRIGEKKRSDRWIRKIRFLELIIDNIFLERMGAKSYVIMERMPSIDEGIKKNSTARILSHTNIINANLTKIMEKEFSLLMKNFYYSNVTDAKITLSIISNIFATKKYQVSIDEFQEIRERMLVQKMSNQI
ncbi:hypothetical protein [Hungatella hathewayi]|uniref:hypothetical protein n=1 Tax=Hungatella hathewayi TaxID=154046 RepID=UPI0035641776